MTPAIKCLILLAVVALLFVTEMIPLAMTAVLAAIACSALGLVPENQIFLGLADSTVVLFGGMFVVGAAMFYTGLAQKVGGAVVKLFGTNENSLMFGLMVISAVMSAFLSNTGTTACLIPVVMGTFLIKQSDDCLARLTYLSFQKSIYLFFIHFCTKSGLLLLIIYKFSLFIRFCLQR